MVPRGDRSGAVVEPYLTDQWYVRVEPLAAPAIAAVETAASASCPRTGTRPISSGCATSRTGASAASSGGAIASRRGTTTPGNVYVGARRGRGARPGTRLARPRRGAAPGRGRARHLVLVRALAVLDARLAGRDAGAGALLPDQRARHRLRHHLLLGRPHDHDGPEVHGRRAVPRGLHPRPGPRRRRPEDVEVEGQRHRPARPRRRHRSRGAAREAHHAA